MSKFTAVDKHSRLGTEPKDSAGRHNQRDIGGSVMPKIEKLERFGAFNRWVSAGSARVREDALLTALKECMWEIRDSSLTKKAALEVIRQIEESR